jgi:hypothetical protein
MASTEKKISIHPDLMFMTSGKTQKNKAPKEKKEQIKMKTQTKAKNHTLRKQSLLRMIRKHQDEKHRQQLQMISGNTNTSQSEKIYNNNMDDTLQFMNNIKEKHSANHTLKNNNYNTLSISQPRQPLSNNIDSTPAINVNNDTNLFDISSPNPSPEQSDVIIQDDSVKFHVNVPQNNIQPKYGCLKDGSLPTYRTLNSTQQGSTRKNLLQTLEGSKRDSSQNAELNALQKYTSHKKALEQKHKQKKIIRRTFNVGKKNKERKISVLISNKKIRSNTTLKLQQLKDISIFQVKNDLIKRGLIKVGCITPESVLRQMYSVVHSMCGSIQNHNAELLLHNYLNGD